MKVFAKLKNDNRGVGIITAVIILVFTAALSVICLTFGYTNLKIKNAERAGNEVYYSVESAVDEIKAGLKTFVSNSLSNAYIELMSDYPKYQSSFANSFADLYFNDLVEQTVPGKGGNQKLFTSSTVCNPAAIRNLVSDNYYSSVTVSGGNVVTSGTDFNKVITISNIKVTCDDNGKSTALLTSIVIKCPNVGLNVTTKDLSNRSNYSMIATGNISYENTADGFMNGNIYSNGLDVKYGNLTYGNGTYINGGDVNVFDSRTFTSNADIWAKSYVVNLNSSLSLNKDSYAYNDLNLKGNHSNVVIKGNYIGFGTSQTDSKESSAILINGKKASLDISGLDSLVLGGCSFIGQDNASNSNVPTGNSISIKPDEKAYLVPSALLSKHDNMYNISKAATTKSSTLNKGTESNNSISVDTQKGTITLIANANSVPNSGNDPKKGDIYTLHANNSDYFSMPVEAGQQYIFEFDVDFTKNDAGSSYHYFVFGYKGSVPDYTTLISAYPGTTGHSHIRKVINVGEGFTSIQIRFGLNYKAGLADNGPRYTKAVFSNISFYKANGTGAGSTASESNVIETNPNIYDNVSEAVSDVVINTNISLWKINGLNKTLASYNVASANGNADNGITAKKIVRRLTSGQYATYYYMTFATPEDANNYFRDYYSQNKNDINAYLSDFLAINNPRTYNKIINTFGSYFVYDGYNYNIADKSQMTSAIMPDADNCKIQYLNMCKSLDPNVAEENSDNPFSKSVIVSEFNKVTSQKNFVKDGKTVAVITNGSYTYSSSTAPDVVLIIAKGNVTVNSDFEGLIVSDGDIIIKSGCTKINPDKGAVSNIGDAVCGSTPLSTYFVSGSGSLGTKASDDGSVWDIDSLIIVASAKKE